MEDLLRTKGVEKYGEWFGKAYDMLASGEPIGGFVDTAEFIYVLTELNEEIENEKRA